MERKERDINRDTFYADMIRPEFDDDESLESCLDMFLEESASGTDNVASDTGAAEPEEGWETDFWGEQLPKRRDKTRPDQSAEDSTEHSTEHRNAYTAADEHRESVRKPQKKQEKEIRQRKQKKPRKAVFVGVAAAVLIFAGTGFAFLSGGEKDLPDVTAVIADGLDHVAIIEEPGITAIENVEDFEFVEEQTYQFEPKIVPEQYQDTEISYVSEDESIVTVDADGVATAVSAGTTKVTVSAGGFSITITVVVYEGANNNWGTYGNYYDNGGDAAGDVPAETPPEETVTPEEPEPTPPAEPDPAPTEPDQTTPDESNPTVT